MQLLALAEGIGDSVEHDLCRRLDRFQTQSDGISRRMAQQCHRFHQILGESFLQLAGPLLAAFREDLLDSNTVDFDGDIPLVPDSYLRLLLDPADRIEGRRFGRMILGKDRGRSEQVEQ